MAQFERIEGTFEGIPAEITASWQAHRKAYEVVAWLNPDGGIPTGHRTLYLSAEQWQNIKDRIARRDDEIERLRAALHTIAYGLDVIPGKSPTLEDAQTEAENALAR